MSPPRRPVERTRTWAPGRPLALGALLGPLGRGRGDPHQQLGADGALWRASLTPAGPGTVRLTVDRAAGTVAASAWGPGAQWLLDGLPALLGAGDDPSGFVPRHGVIAAAWARHASWRVPRSALVLEALVPAVLEQRVTGGEARRSWRQLLLRFGEPAPGPAPPLMRIPLSAEGWRHVPSWEWHRAGVDGGRAETVVRAARLAARLEETLDLHPGDVERRLRAVPGVGVWTAAEVRQRAHGDADAVSVGDFHLAALVGWALVGAPVDDAGMLELLAPYAGHRYRAVRMVELSGVRKPAFGPRYSPKDLRAY